jgi:cysteine desulfurase/selenocysteine lyase
MIKKDFKKYFPILKKGDVVYLDSAATNLKPNSVIKGISDYYKKYSVNSHSFLFGNMHSIVSQKIIEARNVIARKINSDLEEIIFVPSATYALNILAISLKDIVLEGDEILLTELEHSSNFFP